MKMTALLALAALSGPVRSGPLLTAYRTPVPPRLDGRLDETCWGKAITASMFVSAQEDGLPEEQTRVRVCWDERNLYVGIEAFEGLLDPELNMMHLVKAEKSGPDAAVFSEDCVEVFLQPSGERYFHFAANSGEGRYEGEGKNSAWDCAWRCVSRRGDRGYVLEMAIPLAALDAKAEGEWRVNFTRHRSHAKEYSTWSGLRGAFHQPGAFGTLRFAETGPALSPVKLALGEGEAELSAQIVGSDETLPELELILRAAGKSVTATARGTGARRVRAEFPAAAAVAGRTEAVYSLRHSKRLLAASAAIPWQVAAGIVTLRVLPRQAEVKCYLNGARVTGDARGTQLRLRSGLNVIAIEAVAEGDRPGITPRLIQGERELPVSWAIGERSLPPSWRTEAPDPGWDRRRGGNPFWSTPDSRACLAVTAIYVTAPAPPFFPKMDTFHLPRDSSQLMRAYMRVPPEVPSGGLSICVEMPEGVTLTAVDPWSESAEPAGVSSERVECAGRVWRQHRLAFPHVPGQGMELSIRWGDEGGNTISYQPAITAGGTFDWRRQTAIVTPPAGAKSAHPLIIKWQNRGYTGTFWVDNVVFREKGERENLLKMGTFDEPGWGTNSRLAPEGRDGSKCVKIVSTPAGADRQQACWVDREGTVPVEEGKEYVVELDVKCENMGGARTRSHVGLLFRASKDLPVGEVPIATWFEALDGLISELPHTGTLNVLPALKGVRPKLARITPCYYGPRFRNPAVEKAYAENCRASGITWTYGKTSNGVVPLLLPLGHQVFLSISWHPWQVPASERAFLEANPRFQAVDFKGKRETSTCCPTWMLSEGTRMLDALERWLLDIVNRDPYAGANWDLEQPVIDPPTFCTCVRCFAAFRAFSGLAPDVPLSPDVLLRTYPKEWTDFRCAQNAEMAGHLKRMLGKAERPIEFSMYSGYQSKRTREHYGVDWKMLAPHLDFAIAGYGGGRQQIRDTLAALGDVPFMGGEMWYLSHRSDARPAPNMRTWRNRILRQFVESGGNGCLIWQLASMEGGAFYATSEAAEIIARYEEFLKKEWRCDEKVKISGIPRSDWAAFERDGRLLVLLMNFRGDEVRVGIETARGRHERTIEPYGTDILSIADGGGR